VTDFREPDPATVGTDAIAIAREKFPCAACGGEAHWHPEKHALICPYCGTESLAELLTRGGETVIVEHDLAAALRSIPDSARGWRAEKISVRCQSCRAISVFDATKISRRCEFCGSTALVPYEQVKDAFRPESLLPLKVPETRARDLLRQWYGRQWLAPNAFARHAMTDTVGGVYVPYWTFDARVHARWRAESGRYYYVHRNGRRVRQVRWSPVSGELSHVFDDDLVAASLGVHPGLLKQVEPFPTASLVPYDPGYLSGWTVERYQIDLVAASTRSRAQMDAVLREMCARQIPGDTYRNLVVTPTYTNQTFKHILAPIWLLTYVYRGRSYQAVVNGVTGVVAGERPWSWIKITLLALLALAVLVLLAAVQG
jgi:Zn finger protein HypA/HybF involved in hydrogenase expression